VLILSFQLAATYHRAGIGVAINSRALKPRVLLPPLGGRPLASPALWSRTSRTAVKTTIAATAKTSVIKRAIAAVDGPGLPVGPPPPV
jgi:hypothetical protein